MLQKSINAFEESQYNRDFHLLICCVFFVSKGNLFHVYTVPLFLLWDARHKCINSMPIRDQNWMIKHSVLFIIRCTTTMSTVLIATSA